MAVTGRQLAASGRIAERFSAWLTGDVRSLSLGLLVGCLLVNQLAVLPSIALQLAVSVVGLAGLWFLRGHQLLRFFLLGLFLGASYSVFSAHNILTSRLPTGLHGSERWLEGQVTSLATNHSTSRGPVARFDFVPREDVLKKIRVAWYQAASIPQAGDCWRLKLRLRTPRGSANPGTLDYEGWLFRQRIDATASVREAKRCDDNALTPVNRMRQVVAGLLKRALVGHPMLPFMLGLTIGERSDINSDQWRVLRRTGVAHLLAISGLHIGLVAGFCFFISRWLWALFPRLTLRLPAVYLAAACAALAGTGYAAMAGFALPTQRALAMLLIVLLGVLLGQRLQASRLLAWALLLVLLLDPFSVASAGFWLSFAAVGWILYAMRARLLPMPGWRAWLWLQLLLGCALLPLTLFWFSEGSWLAPFVNLLLIPLFFVLVPVILLTTIAALIVPSLAHAVLFVPAQLLEWIWLGLLKFEQKVNPVVLGATPDWTAIALAALGLMWLFAPRGWPARASGLLLCLPLLMPIFYKQLGSDSEGPATGSLDVTVLDVGQGLSVVLRSQRHVLVYDAGPAYLGGFDAGAMVLVPYLRSVGVMQVDRYVQSHGDLDHRGGAQALRRELVVLDELGSAVDKPCQRGQRWRWDDIEFEVLHPSAAPSSKWNSNNGSCVLRVKVGPHVLLLTGDIERPVEAQLIAQIPELLKADVLIVPHHGSDSSSSIGFLNWVAPQVALISAGWRNRWEFPNPRVVRRYKARDIKLQNTAEAGAISMHISSDNGLSIPISHRQAALRFWHAD